MPVALPGTGLPMTVALLAAALSALAGCGHAAPPSTEVLHVVAVDAGGQPADGYREQSPDSTISLVSACSASPAAVGPDVYQCSPSAAGADACWPATTRSLLCVDDPWQRRLHRVTVSDELNPVTPTAAPQPLALLLDDGTRCRRRNGGAWGGRDDGYLGAYSCESSRLVVLVKSGDDAVERSAPLWTVRVGELGAGEVHFPPPESRSVRTAWFADAPG